MAVYRSLSNFKLSNLHIGDLVTYEIVVSVVTGNNTIRPRILLPNLAQGGYPVIIRNTYTRKRREVYHTFLPSENGLWIYKGQCFFFDWDHAQQTVQQLELQGVN